MNSGMQRVAWACALSVAIVGCSSLSLSRWRSQDSRSHQVRGVAILPLLLAGAAQTHSVTNIGFTWMSQYSWTTQLSPAQYQPAAEVMTSSMQRAFSGRRLVLPREVNKAMEGQNVSGIQAAIKAVAQKLGVDAVFVFEVRDFVTRAAGLEPAQAEGRADLVLYGKDGAVLWTLSAQIVRGPAGSAAAPSLTQFIEYATEKLEPEIRSMLDG